MDPTTLISLYQVEYKEVKKYGNKQSDAKNFDVHTANR